jgi:hypothetical protein
MRIAVRISGIAAGITTCQITCHFEAPIEYAACTCSCDTERTPACALIAIDARRHDLGLRDHDAPRPALDHDLAALDPEAEELLPLAAHPRLGEQALLDELVDMVEELAVQLRLADESLAFRRAVRAVQLLVDPGEVVLEDVAHELCRREGFRRVAPELLENRHVERVHGREQEGVE